MNKRFMFAIISFVLAAIVAFGGIALVSSQTSGKTEIIRIKTPVLRGTVVTADQIETVEVGGYNLPANVLKSTEEVVGKYATADLSPGDYIVAGKVSPTPVSSNTLLAQLPAGKVAISMTVPTLASGLSDKLQSGDIIRIYHFKEKSISISELQYVKVLSVTDSKGGDIDPDKEISEDEEKQQSATITVQATPAQAQIITELENSGVIHVALIFRGDQSTADKLLKDQDDLLTTSTR